MRLKILAPMLGAWVVAAQPVIAQPTPVPLRVVVPFINGDFEDMFARMVASQVERTARRSVIVENRPGDEAHFGAEVVARAKPDGATVLFAPVVHYAAAAALYSGLHFDLLADFTPVTLVANAPQLLVTHPSLPAKSAGDLIALAKAQPGQIRWVSHDDNLISKLQVEMLGNATGLKLERVGYKSSEPALAEVLAGRAASMFDSIVTLLPHVKSGRLRALAVSGSQRAATLPQTPTVTQAGTKGFEADYWYAILAPEGVNRAVISQLQGDFARAINTEDLKKRLLVHGVEAAASPPEEVARILRIEVAKWPKVRGDAAAR